MYKLFTWEPSTLTPSSWINYPTHYKFIALGFYVDSSHNVITRQTYDILTFLSDLGGLQQTFITFGSLLVGWYAQFNGVEGMRTKAMARILRQ